MKRLSRTAALWVALVAILTANSLHSAQTKKLKIASTRFEGNEAFANDRLNHVILSRPSRFLSPSYYYPEVFQDDLKSIELFYQQNGYLEAKVTDHQVDVDTVRKAVHLEIQVSEGELTRVEDVSVLGNEVFPDELLRSHIDVRSGEPLRRKKIDDATLSILTLYADNGYLDAEVTPDVRVDTTTHRAICDYTVREGMQCRIGEIHLVGLEKTRPKVVRRELRFRSGQVVDYSRLLESQRRLYLTGLFQSVFIRPRSAASADSTERDILVELKESISGEVNVAVGYESIEKLRGRVETTTTNWMGTARKLGLAAKASFVNHGVEASFTEPWTFGTRWRTDVNAGMDYLEEPGYKLNRIAGRLSVGRSFLKRSSLTLTFRKERAKLNDIKISTVPEDVKTNIRSVKLSLIHDTRDNLFNSTTGAYLEWTNELAGLFLKGTNSFERSIARFKYFHRHSPSMILGTAVEVGWMDSPDGLKRIPLHERFYAGGPNSLRAFDYQKVGPLDEKRVPTGGRLLLVWNIVEIRRSLYKMIGGAVFVDAGNVWSKPEMFKFRELRAALGFGLRVNTPIGLARLDYGINLDRQAGEPRAKLYFSMGQAF